MRRIETTIVDVPLRRPHRHSRHTTTTQAFLIVELHTEVGVIGIGEGVTPGGPWWGGDSVETMKLLIDSYLTPALIGLSVFDIEAALAVMDRVAARQTFAKAALDMAFHDAAARILDIPISHLLGGRLRDGIEISGALGIGDARLDADEALACIANQRFRTFKIKMGFDEPARDVERAIETITLVPDADFRVDLNQSWDEPTAMKWAPRLQDAGVSLFEQPLRASNVEGMRRLCDRLDAPVMADESVYDATDVLRMATVGAADVVALKIAKGGGIRRASKAAAVCDAADLPLFGGTTLESSIGTAASLQLFATLPALRFGCELFGPLLIADDLVSEPIHYRDFQVEVPQGPGLGVELDREKVEKYRRL